MTDPHATLSRCVGDVDDFGREHWGRAPLLHAGADPAGFADLLSVDHVDHLVSSTGLRAPAFRLVRGGKTLPAARYLRRARVGSRPIDDLADAGKVFAEFADGATIVLQGLQRYWPPLAVFCRALEQALSHPVQANAYLTPPVAAGLNVHADAHDVFALQTHGRKQWAVYWDPADTDPRDLTLAPGDALYLPRGTRHAARTVDAASLHITIGVRATTWHDVAKQAVASLAQDPAHVEPLPLGFAGEPATFSAQVAARLRDLARALEKVAAGDVARATVEGFLAGRAPLLDGQLCDLLELDAITDDTPLRRRLGAVCALRPRGDRAELLLGDRTLSLPAHAEAPLRAVIAAEVLRPRELAAHLDEPGRLVLARRLVREGLLRIAREDAPR